jgi:polyisoprenoid-binding protein YceI
METEPGGATFTLGAGSMARYLVNEQLARMNSPIDAIGETDQVEGAIVFSADGSVDSAKSKITVDMASLKSDSDRRDGYVRSNTLETNKYPTAELVVTSTPGLPWPLPSSGEVSFQIVGDMTIHGVTSELTWEATAQAGEGGSVTGTAKTNFTFDTFDMDIPSVFVVVSVQDNIRLEIDFSGTVSGG